MLLLNMSGGLVWTYVSVALGLQTRWFVGIRGAQSK